MSSAPPPVELFKGKNWEECNVFILAIRTRAMWEGKQRDFAWMADFAASYFWQKAMSWHCRLPPDVRQDWLKLEIALVDRWPPPEDDDEPQTTPTPAAAPSVNRGDKLDPLSQSVLKVVWDRSTTDHYLTRPNPVCDLTSDKNQALRVRCNSLASATLLELVDQACHAWLAVEWTVETPETGDGSTDYTRMICVYSDTLKSSWSGTTPFQIVTCTVLGNGEVIPVWKKDNGSKIPLVPFLDDTEYLYLAPDPAAYGQQNPSETRARLFIEPSTQP